MSCTSTKKTASKLRDLENGELELTGKTRTTANHYFVQTQPGEIKLIAKHAVSVV